MKNREQLRQYCIKKQIYFNEPFSTFFATGTKTEKTFVLQAMDENAS